MLKLRKLGDRSAHVTIYSSHVEQELRGQSIKDSIKDRAIPPTTPGPVQACNGTTLPFTLHIQGVSSAFRVWVRRILHILTLFDRHNICHIKHAMHLRTGFLNSFKLV
jgi:hypothetical protein